MFFVLLENGCPVRPATPPAVLSIPFLTSRMDLRPQATKVTLWAIATQPLSARSFFHFHRLSLCVALILSLEPFNRRSHLVICFRFRQSLLSLKPLVILLPNCKSLKTFHAHRTHLLSSFWLVIVGWRRAPDTTTLDRLSLDYIWNTVELPTKHSNEGRRSSNFEDRAPQQYVSYWAIIKDEQ